MVEKLLCKHRAPGLTLIREAPLMFSVPYLVLPASQLTLTHTSTPIFCLERQQSFLTTVHDELKKTCEDFTQSHNKNH